MSYYIKKWIVKSGLLKKLRKIKRGERVVVLRYHSVSPDNPSREAYRSDTVSVTPQLFEQQLTYLTRYYQIMSLDEAIASILNSQELKERGVVITFDDGYEDNFLYAYPLLKQYNATATFYITTGSIDDKMPFWVSYVRQLCSNINFASLRSDFLDLPSPFFHVDDRRKKKSLLTT